MGQGQSQGRMKIKVLYAPYKGMVCPDKMNEYINNNNKWI